jgi:hypothetical protein
MFVPAEDIVVPYGASILEQAPLVNHVMRKTQNELKRLQYEGFYRDIDLDGCPAINVFEIEKCDAPLSDVISNFKRVD